MDADDEYFHQSELPFETPASSPASRWWERVLALIERVEAWAFYSEHTDINPEQPTPSNPTSTPSKP